MGGADVGKTCSRLERSYRIGLVGVTVINFNSFLTSASIKFVFLVELTRFCFNPLTDTGSYMTHDC